MPIFYSSAQEGVAFLASADDVAWYARQVYEAAVRRAEEDDDRDAAAT